MGRPVKGWNEGAFEFYPSFQTAGPAWLTLDVFDIRGLPALSIEIEETEDHSGWGPCVPRE